MNASRTGSTSTTQAGLLFGPVQSRSETTPLTLTDSGRPSTVDRDGSGPLQAVVGRSRWVPGLGPSVGRSAARQRPGGKSSVTRSSNFAAPAMGPSRRRRNRPTVWSLGRLAVSVAVLSRVPASLDVLCAPTVRQPPTGNSTQ